MDVQSDRDRVQAPRKADATLCFLSQWARDQRVVNTPFTFIHATTLTLQDAACSETKAEAHPDPSSHHPQRLDETRY